MVVFVLGKGGVGKTTVCLAAAGAAARSGAKAAVVSLDTAHNLFDLAGGRSGTGGTWQAGGIHLVEVDVDQVLERARQRFEERFQAAFGRLKALGIEGLVQVTARTPGLLETALAEHLVQVRGGLAANVDILFVDLPPTALAVRLLALPEDTSRWLADLERLRMRILDLGSAIHRLHGRPEPGRDRVLDRIRALRTQYEDLASWLREECVVCGVLGPDSVSVRELERAAQTGLHLDLLVWNKTSRPGSLPAFLARLPVCTLGPLGPAPDLDSLALAGQAVLKTLERLGGS